jgi:hypothetical protein
LWRHGHVGEAYPRSGKDCVANRWSQANEACFASARRRQFLAVNEHDLNLRRVPEPGNAVLRKVWVQYPAIGKEDSLEECAADALNNGACELIAQAVRIHDGAALPGLNDTADSHSLGGGINLHLGTCGDIASFVHTAGDAKAALGR